MRKLIRVPRILNPWYLLFVLMILIIFILGVGSNTIAASPRGETTTQYQNLVLDMNSDGNYATGNFITQPSTLVCNGSMVDFESGIPADWTVVNNNPGGIVWTTTKDPACLLPNLTNGSGVAACANSQAGGLPATPYDTELVSNPIDMSTWGGAILEATAYYRDMTSYGNDRFEVDVWDGSGWTNELRWDNNHTPDDITLNLSKYAGLPLVQVRFRYYGDGDDWFAQVDDIELGCVPIGPPFIEVDPAQLSQSQFPDFTSTQPMTITNSGGNSLNWNIAEDDTFCDSFSDIPWLSVEPTTGTTIPLSSTVVDVGFDSQGLAAGDYTANLCVGSDDPATPLVLVPVYLTINPNSAPEVNAGGPYSGDEGSPISLDQASALDSDNDPLTYNWTVNNPSYCSFNDAALLHPQLECKDEGIYKATLTVSDGINSVSSDADVTVNNVSPTGTLNHDENVVEGDTVEVWFTDQSDPSPLDTSFGFLYSYDFGAEGSFEIIGSALDSAVVPNSYLINGPKTLDVVGRIEDIDGGYTDYMVTINVLDPGKVSAVDIQIHAGDDHSTAVNTLPLGAVVHPKAIVTGGSITPTGNVIFSFYYNGICLGTPGFVSAPIALSAGMVDAVDFSHGPLTPGDYSYNAHYSGDSYYFEADSSCEVLTIEKVQPVLTTAIHDSDHNDITGEHVLFDATVHDTAVVNGLVPGFGLLWPEFIFYSDDNCSQIGMDVQTSMVLDDGAYRTEGELSLNPGSYSFKAFLAGDHNYYDTWSECEPFYIDKLQLVVTTTIHDENHDELVDGHAPLGMAVHDTAQIFGSLPGYIAGSPEFLFYTDDACKNIGIDVYTTYDQSTGLWRTYEEFELNPGSYSYKAVIYENEYYLGDESDCEPFVVDKGQLVLTTTIHDEDHNPVTSGHVPYGTAVHDTVAIGGDAFGFLYHYPEFFFYNDENCSQISLYLRTSNKDDGIWRTFEELQLDPGSYAYKAWVPENEYYLSSYSDCEPFIVDRSVPTIRTSAVTGVSVGQDIYDSATISGLESVDQYGTLTFRLYSDDACQAELWSDLVGPINGDGSYTSQAYTTTTAGTFYWRAFYSGDFLNSPVDTPCQDADEISQVVKLEPQISTEIHAGDNHTAPVSSVPLGATVHDMARVAGSGPSPTGEVTFTFYHNATCGGTPAETSSELVLVNGFVDGIGFSQGPLAAGDYAFKAHYSGDDYYLELDSVCEPLTVRKSQLVIETAVHDWEHNDITNGSTPFQSIVHDTAEIDGYHPSFPTDQPVPAFTLYENSTCLGDGVLISTASDMEDNAWRSIDTQPLQAGFYAFKATIQGDTNYIGAESECEPFEVIQNLDPDITIDASVVLVDEGVNANNSGTFSDPEGQVVNITASIGMITQENGSSGLWYWTFEASDGPIESQMVTVTAVDSYGGNTEVTFDMLVTNVSPIGTLNNDDEIDEGSSASVWFTDPYDPSPQDTTAGFTFGFDFSADGSFEIQDSTTSSTEVLASYLADGPGSLDVRGRIKDKDGGYTDRVISISILNVAPSVEAGQDQVVYELETVNLDPATFSDPGIQDTHEAEIDWGDGSVEDGLVDQDADTVSGEHVYASPGVYTVTVTVIDDDGDAGSDHFTVTVVHGFFENCLTAGKQGDDLNLEEGAQVYCSIRGEGKVELKKGAGISGDLIAAVSAAHIGDGASVGGSVFSGDQVDLQKDASVTGDIVSGNDVRVAENALVGGDIYAVGTVVVKPGATIDGDTYLQYPVTPIPGVSYVDFAISANGPDVIVDKYETDSLEPDDYGRLVLDEGATLIMSAGTYSFREIIVHKESTLQIELAGGDLVIDVEGKVEFKEGVEMIVTGGDASHILWRIAGSEVKLGVAGIYLGTFLAPSGSIELAEGAVIRGALHGAQVHMRKNSMLYSDPALALFIELFME